MSRLLVLAEGQSEEIFIKRTLAPHLVGHGVFASVSLLRTKRIMSGGGFKGGVTSYHKLRRDLLGLLNDRNAFVTTLLDFYGLPDDFPGKDVPRWKGVEALEKAFAQDIDHPRFIPFLALHEFEAWLFSRPETVAEHFGQSDLVGKLKEIVDKAGSPEAVNDDPSTNPSARIERLIPSFKKTSDGPIIIEKISLAGIRAACPHFNTWISRLETLGA